MQETAKTTFLPLQSPNLPNTILYGYFILGILFKNVVLIDIESTYLHANQTWLLYLIEIQ